MIKKLTLAAAALVLVCGFGSTAQALSLTPASASLVLSGPDNGQAAINSQLDDYLAAYDLSSDDILYKGTRDGTNTTGISSGEYADSYTTTFFSPTLPDADGTITLVYGGDPIIADPVFAYIKDGNSNPNWYLFDITGWDGVENIEFSGFFVGAQNTQNISHVALYGAPCTENCDEGDVPDGGSTVLLLGSVLLGIGMLRRRFQ